MIIKLSNGEATIKDFISRGTKKEINKIISAGMEMKQVDGKSEIVGFNMSSRDEANDFALVKLVEKIVIDGKELPITKETFDNMNSTDADLIIDAIDNIGKKAEQEKK